MKIAALPIDIVWGDKKENMLQVAEALNRLPKDTDIAVLPELFSTGFLPDRDLISDQAETLTGPTVDALRRWAAFFNLGICGSFLCRVGDAYYNRGFFIEPSGEGTFYDKHHLFNLSREADLLTRGQQRVPEIRFRGWNISFIICYDLRFPTWDRNNDLKYDLMLVPANWPSTRRLAWDCLSAARAIENQAYWVGANRSGRDDYGEYPADMTVIYDYLGQPLAKGSKPGEAVIAEFERKDMDSFREKFPIWRDND